MEPRVGLVPLGPDPDSGLWEFAHVLSGDVPQRGEDGRFAITPDTGIVLVLVPGDSYRMGSEDGAEDERPTHLVEVRPFLLAKYEVTQGQIERLGDGNPSRLSGGPLRPVEQIDFNHSRRVALAAGLRLPSEAEWEYAARAGSETDYWSGGVWNRDNKV